MVIGNGILANIFSDYADDDSVIIFASGVSNSKEDNILEFERELNLLLKYAGSNSRLIYFSTCSVFDASLENSFYIKHKLNIENIIKEKFSKYWIVRLPNVIGNSRNKNTMVNYFCDSIANNKPIILQSNAHRYFIDIVDIKLIFDNIITQGQLNSGCYNLLYPKSYSVLYLVELIEKLLNKKSNYTIEEGGGVYTVNISKELLPYINFKNTAHEDYLFQVLKKYISPLSGNSVNHE